MAATQPNLKPIFDKFAEDMAAGLLDLKTEIEESDHPDSSAVAGKIAALMAQCLQLKEDLETAN